MEVKEKILNIKNINSDQKLVLACITNEFVPSMSLWCNLDTREMAVKLGMTYKQVADTLWCLEELGLISTVVEDRIRTTKITALFKRVTKKEKEILKD